MMKKKTKKLTVRREGRRPSFKRCMSQVGLAKISVQYREKAYRIKLVRNAVIAYSISVGLFILSCCLMYRISILFSCTIFSVLALLLFLAGMVSVLAGVIYTRTLETRKGYQIVEIENSSIY